MDFIMELYAPLREPSPVSLMREKWLHDGHNTSYVHEGLTEWVCLLQARVHIQLGLT